MEQGDIEEGGVEEDEQSNVLSDGHMAHVSKIYQMCNLEKYISVYSVI